MDTLHIVMCTQGCRGGLSGMGHGLIVMYSLLLWVLFKGIHIITQWDAILLYVYYIIILALYILLYVYLSLYCSQEWCMDIERAGINIRLGFALPYVISESIYHSLLPYKGPVGRSG